MLRVRTLFSTIVIDFGSKAMNAILGFVLIRNLAADEYANYSVQVALALFIYQMTSYSFNQILMLSKGRPEQEGLTIYVAVAVLAAPIIFSSWFHGSPVVFVYFLALGLYDLVRLGMYLQKKYTIYSSLDFLKNISILSAVFLISRTHAMKTNDILLIQAACVFFFALVMLTSNSSFLRGIRISKGLLKVFYKPENVQMLAYLILSGVVGQIEIFFLKKYGASSDVATYAASLRYYVVITTALNTVNTLYFASSTHAADAETVLKYVNKHMRYALMIAPVIILACACTKPVIDFINKYQYPDSYSVFMILAVSGCISLAFSPYHAVCLKMGKQRQMIFGLLLGVLVNVVINIGLTPQYKYYGTALSLLISSAITNLSFVYISYRKQNRSALI